MWNFHLAWSIVVGLLWPSSGITVGVRLSCCVIVWDSCRIAVGLLWRQCRILLWCCFGIVVGLLWKLCGILVSLLWYCYRIPVESQLDWRCFWWLLLDGFWKPAHPGLLFISRRAQKRGRLPVTQYITAKTSTDEVCSGKHHKCFFGGPTNRKRVKAHTHTHTSTEIY